MTETTPRAAGQSILVLDDEALLALDVEMILRREGYEVLGPAFTIETAKMLLSRARPDAAVLDIGIGSESSDVIADILEERGVPFLFLSGSPRAELPTRHAARPLLPKPVREGDLLAMLSNILA